MATRFYLPSSGAAAVSPAYDSWTDTTSGAPDRIRAVTTASSTALTDKAFTKSSANGKWYIVRQYVTDPIGVFSFGGTTVSAVLRVLVNNVTNTTEYFAVSIRLYHADTTFDQLLSYTNEGAAWTTTAQTRIMSAVSLASVTSLNGDRLVIEFGSYNAGSATGSRTFTERFGDNGGSDFALTSGLTTNLNPWVEFSGTIPAAVTRTYGQFFSFMH